MDDPPTAHDGPRTLVLGIGNVLLADEGVGVHALRHLAERHPVLPGVRYLDGGTLSFTLAEAVEEADRLIVLDAARLGEAPGAVRCFEADAMDRFLASRRSSVHEVGLADLMDIARLTGHVPTPRALIGIEPAHIGWERPSPVVAAAIPGAARHVLGLLARWSARGSGGAGGRSGP